MSEVMPVTSSPITGGEPTHPNVDDAALRGTLKPDLAIVDRRRSPCRSCLRRMRSFATRALGAAVVSKQKRLECDLWVGGDRNEVGALSSPGAECVGGGPRPILCLTWLAKIDTATITMANMTSTASARPTAHNSRQAVRRRSVGA